MNSSGTTNLCAFPKFEQMETEGILATLLFFSYCCDLFNTIWAIAERKKAEGHINTFQISVHVHFIIIY